MALSLFVRWPSAPATEAADVLARSLERQIGALAGATLTSILIAVDAADPGVPAADRWLDRLGQHFRLAPTCEVTADLAATALDPAALNRLAASGVNRLSLKDGALDATLATVLAAAAVRFPRVAVDLAFGRPGQTMTAWRAELAAVVAAGAGHVSLEEAADGPAEAGADRYLAAIEHLDHLGLPAYEIGHCALPDQLGRQIVDVARGGACLGIGPGAVSRLHRANRWWRRRQIEPDARWRAAVAQGGDGSAVDQPVATSDQLWELVHGGLRLRVGLERGSFEARFGRPLAAALPDHRVEGLARDGLLTVDARGIRLTDRGWPLCDAIVARLLG